MAENGYRFVVKYRWTKGPNKGKVFFGGPYYRWNYQWARPVPGTVHKVKTLNTNVSIECAKGVHYLVDTLRALHFLYQDLILDMKCPSNSLHGLPDGTRAGAESAEVWLVESVGRVVRPGGSTCRKHRAQGVKYICKITTFTAKEHGKMHYDELITSEAYKDLQYSGLGD
jgi:hypothetical protein